MNEILQSPARQTIGVPTDGPLEPVLEDESVVAVADDEELTIEDPKAMDLEDVEKKRKLLLYLGPIN